jgi:hypothetical protein
MAQFLCANFSSSYSFNYNVALVDAMSDDPDGFIPDGLPIFVEPLSKNDAADTLDLCFNSAQLRKWLLDARGPVALAASNFFKLIIRCTTTSQPLCTRSSTSDSTSAW